MHFRDCNYVEECTRLLTCYELLEWSCDTPDCGLNWDNIDDRLDEIHQLLRMEVSLPVRPAEGNDLESQENNHAALEADNNHDTYIGGGKAALRGFDRDGTSHPQTDTGAMDTVPADTAPTTTSLSITVPAALVNIPPCPLSAPAPEFTSHDNVTPNDSIATDDNIATGENIATNDNLATNNDVAGDSSIQPEFDPDSVDLNTFPRCRSCFIGRRRCNGQTPCDKCQQRRCFRSCRPVTVDDLRMYPARAERILNLARAD